MSLFVTGLVDLCLYLPSQTTKGVEESETVKSTVLVALVKDTPPPSFVFSSFQVVSVLAHNVVYVVDPSQRVSPP